MARYFWCGPARGCDESAQRGRKVRAKKHKGRESKVSSSPLSRRSARDGRCTLPEASTRRPSPFTKVAEVWGQSPQGLDLDLKTAAQKVKARGTSSLPQPSLGRGRAAPPSTCRRQVGCRRQVELSAVDQRETSGLIAAGKFREEYLQHTRQMPASADARSWRLRKICGAKASERPVSRRYIQRTSGTSIPSLLFFYCQPPQFVV